jgi:hypothetical protein
VFCNRNISRRKTPPRLSFLILRLRRNTPLKKTALAAAAFAIAVLMLLPVVRSVNLSASKPVTIDRSLSADGWPIPPFPPEASNDIRALLADGWPIPPFPPTILSGDNQTLVADGWPIPPFPPKQGLALLSA